MYIKGNAFKGNVSKRKCTKREIYLKENIQKKKCFKGETYKEIPKTGMYKKGNVLRMKRY